MNSLANSYPYQHLLNAAAMQSQPWCDQAMRAFTAKPSKETPKLKKLTTAERLAMIDNELSSLRMSVRSVSQDNAEINSRRKEAAVAKQKRIDNFATFFKWAFVYSAGFFVGWLVFA